MWWISLKLDSYKGTHYLPQHLVHLFSTIWYSQYCAVVLLLIKWTVHWLHGSFTSLSAVQAMKIKEWANPDQESETVRYFRCKESPMTRNHASYIPCSVICTEISWGLWQILWDITCIFHRYGVLLSYYRFILPPPPSLWNIQVISPSPVFYWMCSISGIKPKFRHAKLCEMLSGTRKKIILHQKDDGYVQNQYHYIHYPAPYQMTQILTQ